MQVMSGSRGKCRRTSTPLWGDHLGSFPLGLAAFLRTPCLEPLDIGAAEEPNFRPFRLAKSRYDALQGVPAQRALGNPAEPRDVRNAQRMMKQRHIPENS